MPQPDGTGTNPRRSARPDIDVAIIGAGVAGLAAATRLRALGMRTLVLEASTRAGGRAHTVELAGAPFDLGASWLHDADANPLTALAHDAGVTLQDFSAQRSERIRDGDRWAEPDVAAAAEARICATLARRARQSPDISLAEAGQELADKPALAPWLASVLAWEGAIIASADADLLSLHDWAANLLPGRNLWVSGGLGQFVATHLVPPAGEIWLETPVHRIARGEPMVLETARGPITARAVIVTISTGVLGAGALAFDPPLPPATTGAIAALPMGLLSKVAIALHPEGRRNLPVSCAIWRRMRQDDPALVLMSQPMGLPYITGFFGGRTAWAHTDPAAAEALVRDAWAELMGPAAAASLAGPVVVTQWGTDPLFRGAYAYARPGDAGARAALAAPLDEGRLIFAGEAVHASRAGTVAGAWESGQAAARTIAARIGALTS